MGKYHDSKAILITALIAFSLCFLHTTANAGTVWLVVGDPQAVPASGGTFETPLQFTTWDAVLGAYEVTLSYDPSLLQILQITMPAQSEFSGNTYVDSGSFSSGATSIIGFQNTYESGHTTPATFATVRWKAVGAPGKTATIAISAKKILDFYLRPIGVESVNLSITLPAVTGVMAPLLTNSLFIPVMITAIDSVGITAYLVTTSSTVPAATASGWSTANPFIYAVTADGTYTLYAWVKDGAGNVSSQYNPITVTVDRATRKGGFTQTDLAGTWYFQVMGDFTSVNAPLWASGTLTINAAGAVTGGTAVSSLGQPDAFAGGTLMIDSAGQVSGILMHANGFTESLPYGKLDASKTILVMVNSNTDGRALFVAAKGGGTFTQADLAGTWCYQVMGDSTSANAPLWGSGTMTVNVAGAVTGGTAVNSLGQTDTLAGGMLTIDSAGQVNGTVFQSNGATQSLPLGKLDVNRSILAMVNTSENANNLRALFVAVKGGGTFAQADLAGTWHYQTYGDSVSANAPLWGSGTMTVNAAGTVTGGTAVNSFGQTDTLAGGMLTIDNAGQVSGTILQSNGAIQSLPHGKLDANRRILAMVNTSENTNDLRALFVAVKGGDGAADLKDAILALQLLAGLNPTGLHAGYAASGADVNGDKKIDLAEVIFILQKVAGIRF